MEREDQPTLRASLSSANNTMMFGPFRASSPLSGGLLWYSVSLFNYIFKTNRHSGKYHGAFLPLKSAVSANVYA